jgi:hypothetical protein
MSAVIIGSTGAVIGNGCGAPAVLSRKKPQLHVTT